MRRRCGAGSAASAVATPFPSPETSSSHRWEADDSKNRDLAPVLSSELPTCLQEQMSITPSDGACAQRRSSWPSLNQVTQEACSPTLPRASHPSRRTSPFWNRSLNVPLIPLLRRQLKQHHGPPPSRSLPPVLAPQAYSPQSTDSEIRLPELGSWFCHLLAV